MSPAPDARRSAGGPCHGWSERFAKVPNAWLLHYARADLSGGEWAVLAYVIARTRGDFDARRGEHGRRWVRLGCAEIAAELEMNPARVRKARAALIKKRLVREFHPYRGQRPAAIGPETLLVAQEGTTREPVVLLPAPEDRSPLQEKAVRALAGRLKSAESSEA